MEVTELIDVDPLPHAVHIVEQTDTTKTRPRRGRRTSIKKCKVCKARDCHVSCVECSCNLCITCSAGHQATTGHHLTVLTEATKSKQSRFGQGLTLCSLHKSSVLNTFCDTCKVPVCSVCLTMSHPSPDHQHRKLEDAVKDLTESLGREEDKLHALQGKVKKNKQDTQNKLDVLYEKCDREYTKVDEHLSVVVEKITEAAEKLKAAQRAQAQELKRTLNLKYEGISRSLKNQVRELEFSEKDIDMTFLLINSIRESEDHPRLAHAWKILQDYDYRRSNTASNTDHSQEDRYAYFQPNETAVAMADNISKIQCDLGVIEERVDDKEERIMEDLREHSGVGKLSLYEMTLTRPSLPQYRDSIMRSTGGESHYTTMTGGLPPDLPDRRENKYMHTYMNSHHATVPAKPRSRPEREAQQVTDVGHISTEPPVNDANEMMESSQHHHIYESIPAKEHTIKCALQSPKVSKRPNDNAHFVDKTTQKNQISASMNEPMKRGDTWYLLRVPWFNRWKEFVGYNATDHGSTVQQQPPGKINNTLLFSRQSDELRGGLVEGKEYVVVPEEAWNKLVLWYGVIKDQQPVPRPVIRTPILRQLKVKVY